MPTSDYLPVATSGSANVDTQADFAGSGYQLNGFQNGMALPDQANKIWRQSSVDCAALTNLIVQITGLSVPDDGNVSVLIQKLAAAACATEFFNLFVRSFVCFVFHEKICISYVTLFQPRNSAIIV